MPQVTAPMDYLSSLLSVPVIEDTAESLEGGVFWFNCHYAQLPNIDFDYMEILDYCSINCICIIVS